MNKGKFKAVIYYNFFAIISGLMLMMQFPFLMMAQTPGSYRLPFNINPTSIHPNTNNGWNLNAFIYTQSSWKGTQLVLDNDLTPVSTGIKWSWSSYNEVFASHDLPNGNVMAVGYTYTLNGERNFYFIEHDLAGNNVAAHKYIDPAGNITNANWVHAYNNSQTLLLVAAESPLNHIACFNTAGDLVWSKRLASGNMAFRTMAPSSDGGFYIACDLGLTNPSGGYDFDFLLVKIDSAGTLNWSKRLGIQGRNELPYSVFENQDGSISLTGYSRPVSPSFNYPSWCSLLRISSTGQLLWGKTFSKNNNPSVMIGRAVSELPNNNIVMAGIFNDTINYGYYKMFLLQLDPLGNVVDQVEYGKSTGRWEPRQIFDVQPTHISILTTINENGFYGTELMVTDTNFHPDCLSDPFFFTIQQQTYIDTAYNLTTPNTTLVRDTLIPPDSTYSASLVNYCQVIGLDQNMLNSSPIKLIVKDGTIELIFTENKNSYVFTLYDALGRVIMNRQLIAESGFVSISTGNIRNGIYFYNIENESRSALSGKLFINDF